MNEQRPTDLDELASSVVDGEGPTTEETVLAGDAELTARVGRFRDLSHSHRDLAFAEAAASEGLDQRIAAAMSAADPDVSAMSAADPDVSASSEQSSVPPRPIRRRSLRLVAAGVAAGLVLAVLSVVALRSTGSSGSDVASEAPKPSMTARSGASGAGESVGSPDMAMTTQLPPSTVVFEPEAAPASLPPATPTTAEPPLPWLGDHATFGQLTTDVEARISELTAVTGRSIPCRPPDTTGITAAMAGLRGVEVIVFAGHGVTVVDPATCRVLTS